MIYEIKKIAFFEASKAGSPLIDIFDTPDKLLKFSCPV